MLFLGKLLLCMGVAAGLSALLTPAVIRLAPVIGAMDVPRDGRRMHHRAMPRTGGIALFFAFVLAAQLLGVADVTLLPLLWGAVLLVLLGLLDDVFRLSAMCKLTVQLLAASLALLGGWQLPLLTGIPMPLARGIALLWVLALTNAHNMIDGLDGLAAGVCRIEAMMLALALWLCGDWSASLTSGLLCGCCIGYLPYNRHPARVFMGDTGSLFLGYCAGMLSLRLRPTGSTTTDWMIPVLLFALPLSDLLFSIARRLSRGQSPFAADRGHWHHRLSDAGWGQRQVCFWMQTFSGCLGLSAVILCRADWIGVAAFLLVGACGGVLLLAFLSRCGSGKQAKRT